MSSVIDNFRMNRYCRTVNPKFIEQLNQKKPRTMAQLADIWYRANGADYGRNQHYNDSRYHMLNYHATFTREQSNSDFSSLTSLQLKRKMDSMLGN